MYVLFIEQKKIKDKNVANLSGLLYNIKKKRRGDYDKI